MTRSLRRHYKSCGKCHGNERLKRKAFRRLRKTDMEGADVKCWGRLFQVRAAATGKARSPTVNSSVRMTFSVSEEEEWRHLWVPKSAVYSSSSARYDGAVPCRHLYTRTASLNSIRSGALSQCSWWRSGVMQSYLDEENTSHAAEFMTNWSCWRR